MTSPGGSPFGRMTPGAIGGAPPAVPTPTPSHAHLPPAPTAGAAPGAYAHAPAPPAAVAGVGAPASVGSLLTGGEAVRSVLACREGDIVATDDRVLVETRVLLLGFATASTKHVFRLSDVGRVALARSVNPLWAVLGVLLVLSGAVAFVVGAANGSPEGIAGVVMIAVGALLLALCRAMAVIVESGSGRVVVRVRSAERPAAQAFVARFGEVLR